MSLLVTDNLNLIKGVTWDKSTMRTELQGSSPHSPNTSSTALETLRDTQCDLKISQQTFKGKHSLR